MLKSNEKKQKVKKQKAGIIYQIYSPSLQKYYLGKTFYLLSLRKAVHKYNEFKAVSSSN